MLKNFFHLLRIARVLVKYSLDDLIGEMRFFRPYVFVFKFVPASRRANRNVPRGDRLCLALEELGPVFIKFGQVLSTRPDLLPMDIAQALTKLQDRVPPFPGDEARGVIEKAFGDSLENHFSRFESEAAASASVAQVHYAQLLDGTDVVVKVLRPGIEEIVERDLHLLHFLARLADRYWSEGKRLKPREIVEDYDRTIHDEFDLKREGANASQLKINFKDSDLIHVPTVYWEHTHRNVMVMERIYGISVRDVDAIRDAGIDMCKLAHDGVKIFFTQAFQHGFFHADMHPGNIFVASDGQYRAVDFGIMGTLSESDKRYLAENLLAFFNRDYHQVADAHIRAGWVPPETNAEDFEGAIRTVCEPIFARPISDISFGGFLIDLFRVARRYKMPVQPQLVLLQKTLLNIEGLGRQLYPDLDLWDTAKPFLEKWMNEQIGPKAAWRTLKRELPNLFTLAPELPGITHQLMYRVKNNEMIFETRDKEIALLRSQLKKQETRTIQLVVGLGLMIMSLMLLPDHQNLQTMPPIGWGLGGVGGGLLLLGALGFSTRKRRQP